MRPHSIAILGRFLEVCKRKCWAGRQGQPPNRHPSPRDAPIVRKWRRIREGLAIDPREDQGPWAVPVRGSARGRPQGAPGAARYVGSRTPAQCRRPTGGAASARSRRYLCGAAAPGPEADATCTDRTAPVDHAGRRGRPARRADRTRRRGAETSRAGGYQWVELMQRTFGIETAAPEEVTELLLDELREPLAVPQGRRVRPESLEVVPDDPVQDGAGGISGVIRRRQRRHAPETGASRATSRHR
jgi:hypothetical protein